MADGHEPSSGRDSNGGWIDVSVPLRTGMVRWPDNPAVSIERTMDVHEGDPATVSRLSMGAHTGTHMDAPVHFLRDAHGIDRVPLSAVIGPARVLAIEDSEAITPEDLARHGVQAGERLLFKTRNSRRVWQTDEFLEDFVYITEQSAQRLAAQRVCTVGIDALSVGGYHADGKAIHRTLLEAGVWIIEGLDLADAPAGPCELICLPLRIADGDGAPARAVVRPLQSE